MAPTRARPEIENEIKNEIGIVPSFFERIPDEALDQEWKLFKRWELEETLIPNKYKELLMLAVHSETKCRYCTLFHTEVARLYGATDDEIAEAVHLAKHTVGWSAYLNGIQMDYDKFEKELEKVAKHLNSEKAQAAR
ncbi:MAG TPA: carboxymuconolactone decarboxylase family protein [Aridibacter sp.]|nr:carboxymuconolactone decarboxylase family protein [Aridibacter sp.]